MVAALRVEAPLGKRDHALITLQVRETVDQWPEKLVYLNYDKGDYAEVRTTMDRNWIHDLSLYTNVEDKWIFLGNKYKH